MLTPRGKFNSGSMKQIESSSQEGHSKEDAVVLLGKCDGSNKCLINSKVHSHTRELPIASDNH